MQRESGQADAMKWMGQLWLKWWLFLSGAGKKFLPTPYQFALTQPVRGGRSRLSIVDFQFPKLGSPDILIL
jgi:hypothetical protein